jgi:hypothetical protein
MLGSPEQIGLLVAVEHESEGSAIGGIDHLPEVCPAGWGKALPECTFHLGRPLQEQLDADVLPDPPSTSWIGLAEPSAMVTADAPFQWVVDFDFTGMIEDDYYAKLFISSNDPDQPRKELPLTVHLSNVPGEGMASWLATSLGEGLLLEWSPAIPDSFSGFYLYRWGDHEEEECMQQLGGGLITVPDDSLYWFLDRGVISGQRYYYRLHGVTAVAGSTLTISPPAHPTYSPPLPTRVILEPPRPNPFSATTTFRIQAPDNLNWDLVVMDINGRLMRRLVRKGELGAGVHIIEWDGICEDGRRAHQGVYYAVTRQGSRTDGRSLILLR